jgi:hypothetical protein
MHFLKNPLKNKVYQNMVVIIDSLINVINDMDHFDNNWDVLLAIHDKIA